MFSKRLAAVVLSMTVAATGAGVYLASGQAATYALEHSVALEGYSEGNSTVVREARAANGYALRFGDAPGNCLATSSEKLQDQLVEEFMFNQDKKSWPHPAARKVLLYVATSQLNAEYKAYAQAAAVEWSKSVCADVRAVAECPANVNCVTMVFVNVPDGGYYGRFMTKFSADRTMFAPTTIELNTPILNRRGAFGRQHTVTHEIGHALGLHHRATQSRIMSILDQEPALRNTMDAVDHANLRIIHGQVYIGMDGNAAPAVPGMAGSVEGPVIVD